jgi:hypothetical protein
MFGTGLIALAAQAAPVPVTAPLSTRVSDTATRFCIDLVSRAVPVPRVGDGEERVFARYGLAPGIPNAAMQALGPSGLPLIARATLASGEASDGAFAVALGGAAGETCRVIVYRAAAGGALVEQVGAALVTAGRGWRELPAPTQSPVTRRSGYLKRDAAKRPFIATVVAPRAAGPVAMVVSVATVPANVALPQGY